MNDYVTSTLDLLIDAVRLQKRHSERHLKAWEAGLERMAASQTYSEGLFRYMTDFMVPFWIALDSFLDLERKKVLEEAPHKTCEDYLEMLQFNLQIAKKGLAGSFAALNEYRTNETLKTYTAFLNMLFDRDGEGIAEVSKKQSRRFELMAHAFPEKIRNIGAEFGFHFDDGGYVKIGETDRFFLYQVLPLDKSVRVREMGKPVVIIPPYVLGAGILAFLPGENKSYVHCFAQQGIPTYIRIMKDIDETPAVQIMTGEDDALDTKYFCEKVMKRHGKPVTLNGFCQGGFVGAADILSGELDGLVDAFITCVAPMDGTRSKSLVEYLEHIPERFRDLGYATKTLPNGNQVVDGKVMSWVYKLKSMEREAPIYTFYRNLLMFDRTDLNEIDINKTAAALNYWLIYERTDLPPAITQMSFDSYTIPVSEDGTLPVKLFGRELNFKRIKEKGIPWLLCYAEDDDLVDKEAALAPVEFVDAEVTVFPKGHGAIATSWSLPTSECSLHSCFGDRKYRGPVRFHLDLETDTDRQHD
jgi:hypothetical protein